MPSNEDSDGSTLWNIIYLYIRLLFITMMVIICLVIFILNIHNNHSLINIILIGSFIIFLLLILSFASYYPVKSLHTGRYIVSQNFDPQHQVLSIFTIKQCHSGKNDQPPPYESPPNYDEINVENLTNNQSILIQNYI